MRIFPGERRASLSAGELADFGLGPKPQMGPSSGLWRAELGRKWHEAFRTDSESQASRDLEVSHEVPVRGVFLRSGWTIEVEGRIDKLSSAQQSLCVSELKTTFFPLPANEDALREKFPHYFVQLSAYLALLLLLPENSSKTIEGELVFADVSGGGFVQNVPHVTEDMEAFENKLLLLLDFLEERRASQKRRTQFKFNPPYDSWREGQVETLHSLKKVSSLTPITFFEAPTGFGKTGIILSWALDRMRDGFCDRILYLTGKSTGQNEVLRTLQRMSPGRDGLRFLCLRSKYERNSGFEDYHHNQISRNAEYSSHSLLSLFKEGTIPEDSLVREANRLRSPPYELIRSSLPFADVVVGDFNYVFHPGSSGLLGDMGDYSPARTLLLIDEAHNLSGRVASCLSPRFCMSDAMKVVDFLNRHRGFRALTRTLTEWMDFLEPLKKNQVLDADETYKASDFVDSIARTVQQGPLPWEQAPPNLLDNLWLFSEASSLLEKDSMPVHFWSPENQSVEVACLDSSTHLAAELRAFGMCLLTSATLSPFSDFAAGMGLDTEEFQVSQGSAPWRKGSLKTAIDCSADTRFATREHYLDDTVSAAQTLIQAGQSPAVIFFPSFSYAEKVLDRLLVRHPKTKVVLQPRFRGLREANEFLETSLPASQALFLVLGSVFSEGIDSLGGMVDRAMIVGPALPEVNSLREAKMESIVAKNRDEVFRKTYLIPGIRKVNQALGRLVRAPGHRAKVVLHCRRFAQSAYRDLLTPDCRDAVVLRNPKDLADWLADQENTVAWNP